MDCNISSDKETWLRYYNKDPPAGRASFASVLVDNEVWISGGYGLGIRLDFLIRYRILIWLQGFRQ